MNLCAAPTCVCCTSVVAALPLISPNGGSVLRSSVALSTYLRWYLHTLAETSLFSTAWLLSILPIWLQYLTLLYSAREAFEFLWVSLFQVSQSLVELI